MAKTSKTKEKATIQKTISLDYIPTATKPLDDDSIFNAKTYTLSEIDAQISAAHQIKGLSFAEAVYLLYQNSELTQEQFAERSGLNLSTIQAYIDPESKTEPKRSTVISICIGLQLPPSISYALVRCAGYCFINQPYDRRLEAILQQYYMHKIDNINQMLIDDNYPPLRKERKIKKTEKTKKNSKKKE